MYVGVYAVVELSDELAANPVATSNPTTMNTPTIVNAAASPPPPERGGGIGRPYGMGGPYGRMPGGGP
ncbi:hypothetical protein FMUAM8_02680 [Nocardia cyriacigeorgica]|nr:hypothetical protein FMUAM8_02680 [Nocardia cyriacigeorgica]BDU03996.1 hypothetical protein FMUBM48_02590 [Nocardia cyriacigeorgica]